MTVALRGDYIRSSPSPTGGLYTSINDQILSGFSNILCGIFYKRFLTMHEFPTDQVSDG
jgi:hypothetical protein